MFCMECFFFQRKVIIDHFITDQETDYLRKIGFDADIVMLPGHGKYIINERAFPEKSR